MCSDCMEVRDYVVAVPEGKGALGVNVLQVVKMWLMNECAGLDLPRIRPREWLETWVPMGRRYEGVSSLEFTGGIHRALLFLAVFFGGKNSFGHR